MQPSSSALPRLRLYVRDGCHLCEEAIAIVTAVAGRVPPFELILTDIEADEQLHKAYLERIPVAELDGREIFELIPDEALLVGALTKSGTFQQ